MAISDQYRSRIKRLRDDVTKLLGDKAREARKLADLASKVSNARQAISRTRSESTIRSKHREIERNEKARSAVERKLAQIDSKIGAKEKDLAAAQKSLSREEARETRKAQERANRQEREVANLTAKFSKHEVLHEETMSALERLQQLPEKIVVLFFASNPVDQQQLRLDEEVRAIAEMIRKSKHRDSVELKSCWAVRALDVLQGLNEHEPHVVHFSGHGSDHDEIVFQDNEGEAKRVTKDAIVQTMMASAGSIRLVFFNTCYSHTQAEAVVQHVEAAIGMTTAIGDEAARVFASHFYSAVGFGHSVQKAFDQAKAALMLEGIPEEDTPELFVADGVDPEELILVRPAPE